MVKAVIEFWKAHWHTIVFVLLVLVICVVPLVFLHHTDSRRAIKAERVRTECERSGGKLLTHYNGWDYRVESVTCVPSGVTAIQLERP